MNTTRTRLHFSLFVILFLLFFPFLVRAELVNGEYVLPPLPGDPETPATNSPPTSSPPSTPTAEQLQQLRNAQALHQVGPDFNNPNSPTSNTLLSERVCTNGTCRYKLLAPIGKFIGDGEFYTVTQDSRSLCSLLNSWFRIGIALAGLFAVVMIVLGGIQYATTDSLFVLSEGKKKIQNALFGLLLALTTYLILYTINPALTSCEIDAGKVELDAMTINPALGALPFQLVGMGAEGLAFNAAQLAANGYFSGQTASGIDAIPSGGTTVSVNGARIDTDGVTRPPFRDDDWNPETGYSINGKFLDATKDSYVVAPLNSSGQSSIAYGTPALIQDLTTGKQIWAVVGDAGPSANGHGEMSLYAAKQIGASAGTSNSAYENHNIKITYYPKK